MTLNREVFLKDPTVHDIPNDGVASVIDPETPAQYGLLRYELEHFVCDGAYQRGLENILSTYLSHLHQAKQPAVWVSGFHGSGKSHLVRVLQHLWCDTQFADGASARGLTRLPVDTADLFCELSTAGKREGGLWSAAGMLSTGAGYSIRLALLAILFRSAGLPTQYAPARFVIWLMQKGYYEAVRANVKRNGENFFRELNDMYMSDLIAESLLAVAPGFASSHVEARSFIKAQYPGKQEDISNDEMLSTMEDVLRLRSKVSGKFPCTLLICDELQQYIGQDSDRAIEVQTVVEACCSHFGTRLLFVATGQSEMQAIPQLQKLQGRFTMQVMLTDADVEQVVRQVVLRKNGAKAAALQAVLDATRGEIDRQLAGTTIAHVPEDDSQLVTDYPLLPVRSRFFRLFLRAIDHGGTVGQLRTQLRMVHEAIKEIADKPLGTVVAGDVIYHQLKANMLQNALLPREVDKKITQLDDESPLGHLKSRLCATLFLIGKLPVLGQTSVGIRADVATLADLLVTDLHEGSARLRQVIPALLQELVGTGTLMQVGDQYRMQTIEGANWTADYRSRMLRIQADEVRIAEERKKEFERAIKAELKGITLVQGQSKISRKFTLHFGDAAPSFTTDVPIWVRDGWSVSEKAVYEEAWRASQESPIIFVFLPHLQADALKAAIASSAAADATLQSRANPTSSEGKEAKAAMETRCQNEQEGRDQLIADVIKKARVYQGGGNEVGAPYVSLRVGIKTALEMSLVRLFFQFDMADHSGWSGVKKRIIEGAENALSLVGFDRNASEHPVCNEIVSFLDTVGKKGSEIRKRFMGAGFGWSQDTVDAALLCLVATGFVRAINNSQVISVKHITTQQLGQTAFFREGVTVTARHKIGVRKLITEIGLPTKQGEEAEAIPCLLNQLADTAHAAGGPAPCPAMPSANPVSQLRALSGNAQFVAVYEQRDVLLNMYKTWQERREHIIERYPRWETLQKLLLHARDLPVAAEIQPLVEAILNERQLLEHPDPVPPLIKNLSTTLRGALQAEYQRLSIARDQAVSTLEGTEEWSRLSAVDRQPLLVQYDLTLQVPPHMGTDEELLAALDKTPLASWEERMAILHVRISQIREEVIKQSLPKAVQIRPPQATLNSVDELDTYLVRLREHILPHLEVGPVVI
jgi:hypothetical protein